MDNSILQCSIVFGEKCSLVVCIQAKMNHQIPLFVRAGGKEPKKKSEKSDVAEVLGEVAKHVSAAFSGVAPRHSPSTTATYKVLTVTIVKAIVIKTLGMLLV